MNNQEKYFEIILETIYRRNNIDFSQYRRGTIERRLARRLIATGSRDYREYLKVLEEDPQEYGRLIKDLTIKVSHFFRDQSLFQILLDELFPDLLNAKEERGDNTLRIWSAGCAQGEETYSITIVLVEYLKQHYKDIDHYHISIFGTDVDEDALDMARFGVYDVNAIKEVEDDILKKYFIPITTKKIDPVGNVTIDTSGYQLIDSIRNLVVFSTHNLTSRVAMSPSPGIISNYDLIFCRNVLIYFSHPLQEKAFFNLSHSLNSGGFLVLGKSESIPKELENVFIPYSPQFRIYKKK